MPPARSAYRFAYRWRGAYKEKPGLNGRALLDINNAS
jgi:hypothetical protein